jgi:DNA-binding MarR family transcriptional regulator
MTASPATDPSVQGPVPARTDLHFAILDTPSAAQGDLHGPDPDQALVHAAVAALRAMNLAGERFRHAAAEHLGVDPSAITAISHLSAAGPLSPNELATRVALTPSSITALLDRLEHAGYAQRSPHPSDRRRTIVIVTDHGQEALTQIAQWMTVALGGYNDTRLTQVSAILTDIANRLTAQTARITTETSARPHE